MVVEFNNSWALNRVFSLTKLSTFQFAVSWENSLMETGNSSTSDEIAYYLDRSLLKLKLWLPITSNVIALWSKSAIYIYHELLELFLVRTLLDSKNYVLMQLKFNMANILLILFICRSCKNITV